MDIPLDLITAIVNYLSFDRAIRLSITCQKFYSGYIIQRLKQLNVDSLPSRVFFSERICEHFFPERIYWRKSNAIDFKNPEDVKRFVQSRLPRVKVAALFVGGIPSTLDLPFNAEIIERLDLPYTYCERIFKQPCPRLRQVNVVCYSAPLLQVLLKLLYQNATSLETLVIQLTEATLPQILTEIENLTRARALTLKHLEVKGFYSTRTPDSNNPFLRTLFPELVPTMNAAFVPIRKSAEERFGAKSLSIFYIEGLPIWYSWIAFGPRLPQLEVLYAMWTEFLGDAPVPVRSNCLLATATALASKFGILTSPTPEFDAAIRWILQQISEITSSQGSDSKSALFSLKPKCLDKVRTELATAVALLLSDRSTGDFVVGLSGVTSLILEILQDSSISLHFLIVQSLQLQLGYRMSWRALEHFFTRFTSKQRTTVNCLFDANEAKRYRQLFEASLRSLNSNNLSRYFDVLLLSLEHFDEERDALVKKLADTWSTRPVFTVSGVQKFLPWPESIRATRLLVSCSDEAVSSLIRLHPFADITRKANSLVTNCVRGLLISRLFACFQRALSRPEDMTMFDIVKADLNEACWRVVLRDTCRPTGGQRVKANLSEIVSELFSCFGTFPQLLSEVSSGRNQEFVVTPELRVIIDQTMLSSGFIQ